MELDYIPFEIRHIFFSNRMSFIISGSDQKIHVYSRIPNTPNFEERKEINLFPQLSKIASCAITLDIKYHANKCILAAGKKKFFK